MATCPKRGVLNAGDRPGRIQAAVARLEAAAQPFHPRVMPVAQRRAIPMSTPMRAGSSVPLSQVGTGLLPRGNAVQGSVSSLGNPGTMPITHGALGPGGTSSGSDYGGPLGALAPLAPFISAITDWAREVSDAIQGITDTISADGMAVLWAVDQYLGPYTEPLNIWRPEWRPMAVIAGRIQDSRAWTSTVLTGGAVHWDLDPSGETLKLKSIDGMTPNDGHTYLITFLYFGIG